MEWLNLPTKDFWLNPSTTVELMEVIINKIHWLDFMSFEHIICVDWIVNVKAKTSQFFGLRKI